MKIRISRVTGYRDIAPRFSVEVQEMRQPIIQEVVLINGIQFTNGQPERLEWVPCQDRTILEQIYNGGIVDWFNYDHRHKPDYLIIETNDTNHVIRSWYQSDGMTPTSGNLLDNKDGRDTIQSFIKYLNAIKK